MTNVVQPQTGSAIKPGPMITVVQELSVTDDLQQPIASDTGLNAPFVADQLSAFITHDRMGVNLFRMLAARSDNPVYQALYADLLGMAQTAVESWEQLITGVGGNPQYASPVARMTEGMDAKIVESFLLNGSADPLSFDTAGLMAAYVAECQCVLNTETLCALADQADDGSSKQAMQATGTQMVEQARAAQKLVREAIDKSTSLQAKSGLMQKAAQAAETVTAKVKNTLSDPI